MVAALVVLGLLALTPPALFLLASRDFWVRLHVPGVVQGLLLLLLAVALEGGGESRAKAALIALFLVLTTPISNHALTWARRAETRRRRAHSSPPTT